MDGDAADGSPPTTPSEDGDESADSDRDADANPDEDRDTDANPDDQDADTSPDDQDADTSSADGPPPLSAEVSAVLSPGPDESRLGTLRAALGRRPLWQLLAVVTAVSLLVRLLWLDARSAHWDEARVAHWVVHYNEFGAFAYRRIIHGPLIQHVDSLIFPFLGRTDFAMRLPVAVVGGLLPFSAYLFREHLDRDEAVAMALLLAGNSVLVYYSRFMRSDVLVAAFMFTAFGMLVRFYDTRRVRYVYAFGVLTALGLGSKENAIIYILTWLGAAGLLVDIGLHRPHTYRSGWERLRASRHVRHGLLLLGWVVVGVLVGSTVFGLVLGGTLALGLGVLSGLAAFGATLATLETRAGDDSVPLTRTYARYGGHLLGTGVVALAIIVFLFAPRGAGLEGIYLNGVPEGQPTVQGNLWGAISDPLSLPGFVADTLQYTYGEYASWFAASTEPGCFKENVIDGYLCFLGRFLEVVLLNALVLGVFGLLGFVWERYAADRSRNLVMLMSYIALVSVVGYPLGTDIFGGWIVVHAVVPMTIPAAVGIAHVYRWGRGAASRADLASAAILAGPTTVLVWGVARFALDGLLFGAESSAGSLLGSVAGTLPSVAHPIVAPSLLQVVVVAAVLAAAGVVALLRREAPLFADDDSITAALVAGLLVVTALQVGLVTTTWAYDDHSGERNVLVQYAQPADDLDPMVDRIEVIADEHRGKPDVVLYSTPEADNSLVQSDDDQFAPKIFRPLCSRWVNTLPLNWYLVAAEADVDCRQTPDSLTVGDPPPMIIAPEGNLDLSGTGLANEYDRRTYRLRKTDSDVDVYVHQNWTDSGS